MPEESFEGNCEGEGIISEAGEVRSTSSDAAADVAAAPAMAAPAAAAPAPTRVQRMKVSATAAVEMVSQVTRRSSALEAQPATRSRPKLGKRAQIRATAIPPWQVTTVASTSTSDGGDGARRVGLGRVGQLLTGLSNLGPDSNSDKRRRKVRLRVCSEPSAPAPLTCAVPTPLQSSGRGATHMLLYLNNDTFVGEKGETVELTVPPG